jgi:hypothetical protein
MTMTTIHKIFLTLLLFCAAGQTVSGEQNGHFGQGKGTGRNSSHGGSSGHNRPGDIKAEADRIISLCLKNNLSAADIDQLLQSVRAADAASLPTENIVLKIEEGLAKQVEPSLIARAAEVRLDYLRQANGLVKSVRTGHGGGLSRLTGRIALVLESGLPSAVVEDTLRHPGRRGPGRIIRVIDAGATLHQAGLNAEQTQQFINDSIDRDLNGSEIARALDFVLNGHSRGVDFQSIRQQLWGSPDSF